MSLFILSQPMLWEGGPWHAGGPGHWGGGPFFPFFFFTPWVAFLAGALLVFVVMRLANPR
jgi:hypothetical protein